MNQTEAIPAGGKFRWVICALLFAACVVNYMDRQVLGLLKPALSRVVRPIATLFAASMLLIAVIDIIRGETPMLAETHHLLEVAAVGLIWVISLPAKAPPADERFMRLSIVADDDGEQTAAS